MRTKIVLLLVVVLALALGVVGLVSAQDSDLSGRLEIFSWWAGDEGPALEALISRYNELYPNVEVVNAAVTGGAGVNAQAVLKTRMLGGDVPDSFQVHAGQSLIGTWVVADRMEDLTSLYQEEGWMDQFPQGLLDLISTPEGIWSVPVNIHRSNVMWYVPANLEQWGVEAPASWDDFLAMCPTLQAAGVTPLALGENWTVVHLWESVAVAGLGADGWKQLWTGELSFSDPRVVAVWQQFGQILDCTNEDAASLSWQQAVDKVVNGEAAFNVMGDWAAGYMITTLGLTPGDGFGWQASPGTDGTFIMLADSFGLPVGAPDRDNTLAWLRLLGSADGQTLFNPLKGSIPANLTAEVSSPTYSDYSVSASQDWANNTIVGSLMHGAVGNDRFQNDFQTVVIPLFLDGHDANAAANAVAAVAAQDGIGS